MTVRNRSGAGPFIRSKTSPLVVQKHKCFRVLMRQQKPGPQHGRWEPISSNGFVVVAASKLEAYELVWFVGGRFFPRPDSMVVSDRPGEDADFKYLRWLMDYHFVVEPYTKGSDPMEVWFSDFVRGWYPAAEDIPGATKGAKSEALALLEPALRSRWENR